MIGLTQTDLCLAAASGVVEHHDDCVVVRQPNNPGYYWGNYVLLPAPPEPGTVASWIERARAMFANAPGVHHELLRWDGLPASAATLAEAQTLGLRSDEGLELTATALHTPAEADVTIRPLDLERDRAAIVELNVACDPAEQTGSDEYRRFKTGLREAWWVWGSSGLASWWGAFRGDTLVAQCGLAMCAGGLGRFQSVETHPDSRRQGICSTLIASVGSIALERGAHKLLLAVDGEGPAVGLYRRLGFGTGTTQRSLLRGGERVHIRDELPADHAEIRSIVIAAFGAPDQAERIEAWRGTPGLISLVADRSGTLVGHAVFRLEGLGAEVALRHAQLLSLAVRPSVQRQGIGTALTQAGRDRCRAV